MPPDKSSRRRGFTPSQAKPRAAVTKEAVDLFAPPLPPEPPADFLYSPPSVEASNGTGKKRHISKEPAAVVPFNSPSAMSRPLPYNIEAEEAVLGSLMIDNASIAKILNYLSAGDFYREKHQWLYEALVDLHNRSEPADPLTLADELDRKGRLSDVGGPAAISELFQRVPTAIHIEYYGRIVERNSVLRRLVGAAEKIAKLGYEDADIPIAETLARAEQYLFEITATATTGAMVPARQLADEFYERVEDLHLGVQGQGVSTGFTDLDRLLAGFNPGDLILLAARPSVGKTALALNILENSSVKYGARVAYFSLEMGREQIMQRLFASQTGIDAQRLRAGPIYESDLELATAAVETLGKAAFWVDDTAGISVAELRTKVKRLVSEFGLDLVLIDYLQLMNGKDGGRSENRVQEVSYISRSLKELAREVKVPIVGLSQLSRALESRSDKRPMLSDLRESGSLEQDSDVVMFLYRDEVYNKNTERPNLAEVIIAKHRNGPIGTVELRFTRETARYSNLETYTGPDNIVEFPARNGGLSHDIDDIIF